MFGVACFVCLAMIGNVAPESLTASKLSVTDISTLVAGVVGAALGGFISWMLARQSSAETRLRDEAARRSELKASALSLLLKVQQIVNGYYTQRQFLYGALEAANEKGLLWNLMSRKVSQQIGFSDTPPQFEASEFVPLMLARQSELINDCSLLAHRYGVLEESFTVYNNRRDQLQAMILPHSEIDASGVIVTAVPADLRPSVEILEMQIEGLIKQIYQNAVDDYERSFTLCNRLSEVLLEFFDDDVFVKFRWAEN